MGKKLTIKFLKVKATFKSELILTPQSCKLIQKRCRWGLENCLSVHKRTFNTFEDSALLLTK